MQDTALWVTYCETRCIDLREYHFRTCCRRPGIVFIHPSAWNRFSANFALTEFSESGCVSILSATTPTTSSLASLCPLLTAPKAISTELMPPPRTSSEMAPQPAFGLLAHRFDELL